MKHFVLTLFLLGAMFATGASDVKAQGEWSCDVQGSDCVMRTNCAPGYMPPAGSGCPRDPRACSGAGGECVAAGATGEPAGLGGGGCPQDSLGNAQLNTAIGCIPLFDQSGMASFLLRWGIGVGAGIAFLFIVYSGFLITTSAGNPQRLQAGKELLMAALSGLLLLIFSATILRIIGVDIFRILRP